MNTQLPFGNFQSGTFRSAYITLYQKHKDLITPTAVIVVCILLLWFVIVPQINEYLNLQTQVENTRKKIATLRENLSFLTALPIGDVDEKLELTSDALPGEKDFQGIVEGIAIAAGRANVAVDDFSLSIGDLSATQAVARPFIQVTLNLRSGLNGTERFISEISKTFPLAQVETAQITTTTATVAIKFHYKVIPKVIFNEAVPIPRLNSKDLEVINRLKVWKNDFLNTSPSFVAPVGSSSSIASPSAQQ